MHAELDQSPLGRVLSDLRRSQLELGQTVYSLAAHEKYSHAVGCRTRIGSAVVPTGHQASIVDSIVDPVSAEGQPEFPETSRNLQHTGSGWPSLIFGRRSQAVFVHCGAYCSPLSFAVVLRNAVFTDWAILRPAVSGEKKDQALYLNTILATLHSACA
ncbi:hypothetical protein CALCODRAFT_326716 [Calocera cornea HHB12733]|uniref:Uncharacterized protein n=1 Tax=Calocera cornea HHB12733 TaxID=1353952 RepID=A0A165JGC9_9BASI|nr:hypothetical protein CALCODRAFT_326716 [Calocera cornea HHB12733]